LALGSGLKYHSGRKTFIGGGLPTDISILDATKYEGQLVLGTDESLYFSNGVGWVSTTLTSNNTTFAFGKTEAQLNGNNASTADLAVDSNLLQGYNWASPASIGGGNANNAVFTDVIVSGNLFVGGTTTTVNTAILQVSNGFIVLNKDQTTPIADGGLIFQRYGTPNTTNYNAAFVWDENADRFVFGATPNTAPNSIDITISDEWLVVDDLGNVTIKNDILANNATFNSLSVSGNSILSGVVANNSLGANGYVLTSNGSSVHWTYVSGDVGFTGSIGFTGSQGNTGFTGSASTVSGGTGFTGSIGFTGSQGDIGYTGSVGYTGSLGFTGSQGIPGEAAAQGYTGSVGFTGSAGFTGSIGFTGSRGDTGFTGSASTVAGATGFTGSQGIPGEAADQGYTGSVGFTGSAGFTGSVGFVGSRGITGYTGSQGALGFTGSRGVTGFTGSASTVAGGTGFTGSIGIGFTGSSGFTGSVGLTGFTGSKGDIGFSGFTGSVGFTGSLGFTGSQGAGVTGSQGTTGFTGSRGTTGFTGSIGFTGSGISTASNTQLNSLGVGTAASGTAGEIRATNNITAYYSDDRLKTNLGNIPNALDMLLSLNGFYFEPNSVAQALGYVKRREVGVSAQQVHKILPEITAPAPIDEQYMTVRYEKLIPLLIEAIKELNNKVKVLESK
jgi:hypothetical protein